LLKVQPLDLPQVSSSGGNIGESLKGGALGGLGAQLSNAIGHNLGFSDGSIGQTFAHGVSQGTISHLHIWDKCDKEI